MPRRSEQNDVQPILARARELEDHAHGQDDGSELIAEAVILCAGKIQDMTTPESAHCLAAQRILSEYDIGSYHALRRMRGVLRAAAQLDGVNRALDATDPPDPQSRHPA